FAIPTYPVALLWCPRIEKTGPKSYGRYTWAEESLLPDDTFPIIISNDDHDDDLVSMSELFVRAGPGFAPTATPAAGTPQAADLGRCTRKERPNDPKTTPRGATTTGFG